MLDYDREAAHYDATRGGVPRAEAAALACVGLLTDAGTGPVVDLACGTGLVTAALARRSGRVVIGVDQSMSMARLAGKRSPRLVVRADAGRLPFGAASVSGVTAVWLLHLLPPDMVEAVVGEVARILRPGGRFLTTVDKNGGRAKASDRTERVSRLSASQGLHAVGTATFVGHGQGRDGRADPVYWVAAFAREGR